MTRILVLEEVSPAGLDALRAIDGFEVQELYDGSTEAVQSALLEADALIVRSKTRVSAEFLGSAPQLKVIGRPGTGVDNIDVPAATRHGIVVMNTPAGNSVSAAEHAMGLLLSLARRIAAADASMKAGRWDRQRFMGTELEGKTIGIIGYGKIGSEVARRARSFGMRVVVCDPFVPEAVARDQGMVLVPLETMLAESDVVSLHAPLNQSTRRMLNAETLAKLKDGAYLVNAARGELVDEEALLAALKSGKLAGAGLDVFAGEPRPNAELVALPNVVATPHIGASTIEAQEKVGYDIAIQIRDFFVEGIVRNAVNFPAVSQSEYQKSAPYLQLAEKLGSFASQCCRGRMEEVAVRYYGELAGMSSNLIAGAVLVGVLRPIMTERVSLVNALATAAERGLHFVESRSSRQRDFSHLISLKLISDAGEEWVEGTVLHGNHMRLVSLYGIDIDAPLEGDMLILRNSDTPGVIGRVGTILGANGINIANFALGRNPDTREAVGVVNVDSEIPPGVCAELSALPQVKAAFVVHV